MGTINSCRLMLKNVIRLKWGQCMKDRKSIEPRCICNWMSSRGHFTWSGILSDRPPVLWWLSPGEGPEMPLHNAVGINCKKGATILKIEGQVSSIWAKGCMLYDCMCVIWLDMTTPSWRREKVMVYYYYYNEFWICLIVISLMSEDYRLLIAHDLHISQAYLSGISLWPAYLSGISLWPAYLSGISLWPTYLSGVSLMTCRSLRHISHDLQISHAYLSWPAYLSGISLMTCISPRHISHDHANKSQSTVQLQMIPCWHIYD